jgi:FkbM family methyltransferase
MSTIQKILKRLYTPSHLTFEGINFHDVSRTNILKNIWHTGAAGFEPEVVHFLKTYPFDFKNFMDCGANIGVFSALVSKVYPDISVTAFEPFHNNISYLKTLRKNNSLRFKIEEAAISNISDNAKFYIPHGKGRSELSTSASLKKKIRETNVLVVDVKVEPFDKYLSALKANDFPLLIKMDIEDNELEALQSIEQHLKDQEIDLIVEIVIGSTKKKALFQLMRDCGYSAYLITNSGLIHENRPITLAAPEANIPIKRTVWKNHYFTKKSVEEIAEFSYKSYGYFI